MRRTLTAFILAALMVFTLLPIMSVSAWAAGEQMVDSWTATQYTLNTDGDKLTITAEGSYTSPVDIYVTAPAGSAVTIVGRADQLYDACITVQNPNITLNLVNLRLAVTEAHRDCINFTSGASGTHTINVTGDCYIHGGDGDANGGGGEGIRTGDSSASLTISGNGTLEVIGGDATTSGRSGGSGIYTNNLTIGAEVTAQAGESVGENSSANGLFVLGNLTINAPVTASGGSVSGFMGGRGIQVSGNTVINAHTEATGGDGETGGMGIMTHGNITINSGGETTATGGEGASTSGGCGGDGINVQIAGNTVVIGAPTTATGGEGYTGGSGLNVAVATNSTLTINAELTAIGGDSANGPGGYGLQINGSATIGALTTATGGDGGTSGGYGLYSIGDLTINAQTYATGGSGTDGGPGLSSIYGDLAINAEVHATGGDGSPEGGADGFSHGYGSLTIGSGASITATGGDGYTYGGNGMSIGGGSFSNAAIISVGGDGGSNDGGRGVSSWGAVTIAGGTLSASGGDSGAYGTNAILTEETLTITNATIEAIGGNGSAGANPAICSYYDMIITNSSVTATSGGGTYGGNVLNAGILTIDNSDVTATGGSGTADNYAAVYSWGGMTITNNSNVTVTGGHGGTYGGAAIYSDADITIDNGSDVSAIGGTGTYGGFGVRAAGWDGNSNAGSSLTIAAGAGDVYIRGGSGRAAVRAKDVFIATGNVGAIEKETGAATLTVKNKSGGDVVYMLTANANPAAATTISAVVTTGVTGISPSYTYNAPAKSDGIAYMWLPAGSQTVSTSGYDNKTATVNTGNTAVVTLLKSITTLTAANATITAPATGATPQTAAAVETATNAAGYTVSGLTWNGALTSDGKFAAATAYTVAVTLTAKPYYKFQATAFTPTVSGAASVGQTTTSGGDVAGNNVTFTVAYAQTAALSNDAALSGLTISDGTLTPAFNSATTSYTAAVANSVSGVTITAVKNHSGASLTGDGTKTLSVGANTFTITVTAEDGITTKAYTITITRDSSSGGGSGSGGSSGETTADTPSANVLVDGKAVDAGTVTTGGDTTTVTVNQKIFSQQLETATNNVTIIIPAATGTAVAELVVQNVDDMAANDMTLTVQVGNVQYEIPATAIDTAAVLAALGADNTADVTINIIISTELSAAAQAAVAAALADGATLVIPPLEFTATATYNGQTVEIDTFGQYVNRSVEITAEQAAQITTAVVVEPDGTTRQVPTRVYQQNGKWYAEISSLTNSTYAFVHNEMRFADATGKWYEGAANEMGSRMIISGGGDGMFAGERDITRAEFAAIIVRALGLPATGNGAVFSDVSSSAWYCGAVGTAYEYGLASGTGDGQFSPNQKITRQEAMLMIQRAAQIAGFNGGTGGIDSFTDAGSVSSWALDAARWNVGSGLVVGSDSKLNPTNNITRAETATLVLKLLQQAGLVDVRTPLTMQGA